MAQVVFFCIIVLLLIGMTSSGQEIKKSDPPMVLIQGGEFMMGKDSEEGYNYSPSHRVKVDSFYMDRHEVTNGEYKRFCEEIGKKLPEFWNSDTFRCGDDYLNYPVVGISWVDAMGYAQWAGKRLPTEAEWEYAARGGLVDMDFPNGSKWTKKGARNDAGQWRNLINPVESYEPNGYGLYDMGGNVWEWIGDIYSRDYYKVSEKDNPKGPEKGSFRLIRGGSWHSGAMCKRVYYRKGLSGNWCDFAVGFRCVKDLDSKAKE